MIPNPGFARIPFMGLGYCQDSRMRPRDVLAENIKKLMGATPALSTFQQITAAGGGSNGTLDRIRRKETATGIDNLEPLAGAYGVSPWQLLVPDLRVSQGADGKPLIASPGWPFDSVPLARFEALTDKQKGYVEARLLSAIEECERGPTTKSEDLFQPATGRKSLIHRRKA